MTTLPHLPFDVVATFSPLQAFPSSVGKSKPGMIMGMVLAAMPMLGKALGEDDRTISSDSERRALPCVRKFVKRVQ